MTGGFWKTRDLVYPVIYSCSSQIKLSQTNQTICPSEPPTKPPSTTVMSNDWIWIIQGSLHLLQRDLLILQMRSIWLTLVVYKTFSNKKTTKRNPNVFQSLPPEVWCFFRMGFLGPKTIPPRGFPKRWPWVSHKGQLQRVFHQGISWKITWGEAKGNWLPNATFTSQEIASLTVDGWNPAPVDR